MRMLLVLLVAIFAGNTAHAATIFFLDRGTEKIQRVDTDGSNLQDLVVGQENPRGIALDVAAGKMYWTESENDKIRRANLDGSNVEDLVTTGLVGPRQLALSLSEGKMYWADIGTNLTMRADLDGTNVENVFLKRIPFDLQNTPFGVSQAYGVAVDPLADIFFLSSNQSMNSLGLQSIDPNADNPLPTWKILINVNQGPFRSIALDLLEGKVYLTHGNTPNGEIVRINTDGTGLESIVTGLGAPEGITLFEGKVYWTDPTTGKIQRADLNGDNVEDVITDLSNPSALAIIPEQSPFINLSPTTATNDVLTEHTVTAAVERDGMQQEGVLVVFEVIFGPNAGEMSDPGNGECTVNDDCTTDANGQVSWTYTGSRFSGTDTIVASFFVETTQEVIDSNLVEKIWVIPPSNVPTLSEWGLIAMAGILGIIGFVVIRRRKVNA